LPTGERAATLPATMKRAQVTFDSVRYLRNAITAALLQEQREAAYWRANASPACLIEPHRGETAETGIRERHGARGE
jgi:hypothetical protein